MQKELDHAINLRKEGKKVEANALLVELVERHPDDPVINYHCAWSFDVLGEEAKAVPFYEKAIQSGLSEKDLEGAFLGLGSTYRTLGEYDKSQKVFRKGIESFPANKALQVFYSMTLHNLDDHNTAMEMLLKCLAETTTDPEIKKYEKAIRFYADKLDQVWE